MLKINSLLAISGLVLAGWLSPSSASPITWIASGPVTGDADIDTNGLQVGGLNVGQNSTQTALNGVIFNGDPGGGGAKSSGAAGPVTFTFDFDNSINAGFWNNSTADPSYNTGLNSSRWVDGSNSQTVVLGSLTNGQRYEVEVWNVDTRGGDVSNRVRTFSSPGDAPINTISGGNPQWAIGSFTADATTTQTIDITTPAGPYGPQLNLIEVRAVPEPSTLILLGLAGVGLFLAARRRK